MRVSLKQSVNQSHTNSQGSLVAISDGVDAWYPWTQQTAIDLKVCVCHDGEQYCGSALTIDCHVVALRRSGHSDSQELKCLCMSVYVHLCVCV